MAPGEKAKLKKTRVLAKRAARAESRGFDYGRMNGQLAEFVASGGDMMVRPLKRAALACLPGPLCLRYAEDLQCLYCELSPRACVVSRAPVLPL